jgi:sugar diacid utilization regulator
MVAWMGRWLLMRMTEGSLPGEMGRLDGASTLQELADTISELIGNPITIEASDFRLLAYSQHAEKVDTVRLNTILLKRAPDNIARLLSTSGILASLTASSEPLRVSLSEVGLTDRVAIPVKVGDTLVGVMWVHEVNRKLHERDFLLLKHATRLAAGELAGGSQRRRLQRDSVSRFLTGLVTGEIKDPVGIAHTARQLGIELPVPFLVTVMEFPDRPTGDLQAFDLLAVLAAEISGHAALMYQTTVVWAIREGEVVFLSGFPAGRRPLEAIAVYIGQEARNHGYVARLGVSRRYDAIEEASHAYDEARACLAAAVLVPGQNVLSSRAIGVLQLLPAMLSAYRCSPHETGVGEKVALLLKQDAQARAGFSFADTLETYFDCGRNVKEAASRLHIHSHALHYRLKRIIEVTGLDLLDGVETLSIHLELKLRRLNTNRG